MNIAEAIEVRKIRETLKRGRPLALAQVHRLKELAPPELPKLLKQSVELACQRLDSGGRLNADYRAAFAELAPALAADYDARTIEKKHGAKSSAERVQDYVARASDIGPCAPVFNPARRESCRLDLAAFGRIYCTGMLDHPPSERMLEFITAMQRTLLNGGKLHVRWPRGKGKTSWVKIAAIWAAAYGHRRFIVVISATAPDAESIVGDIVATIETSETLCEDFPEIAHPVRSLEGVVQRCKTQHIDGARTDIELRSNSFTFPTVAGSVSSGSMIRAKGIKGSLRGLVRGKQRPDFVFVDDAQTRADATSPSETRKFLSTIRGDIDGLAGHNKTMSTIIASTPVAAGDGSSRLADPDQSPGYYTLTVPLVLHWPTNMALWEEWQSLYKAESVVGDIVHRGSRDFYLEHRAEMDLGAEVIDPADGDPATEESALHHAFVRKAELGEAAFAAEYQMQVEKPAVTFELSPDFVASRLNGFPRCQIPISCSECVAYCDVNAEAGMRWGVAAFGRGNVCAVVAYGRYPDTGRLYPENANETEIAQAVAAGMMQVVTRIAALPLYRNKERKRPWALVFDGGWQTRAVGAFCQTVRAPFRITWSKGFGCRSYRPRDNVAPIGDHCHLSRSDNGTFLAIHADYWREYAQRAFLAHPLTTGSLSLYGTGPGDHALLAEEVCAETLVEKRNSPYGVVWEWDKHGPNHYGDVVSNLCAVAGWYRLLQPADEVTATTVAALAKPADTASDTPSPTPLPLPAVRPKKKHRYITPYVAARRR